MNRTLILALILAGAAFHDGAVGQISVIVSPMADAPIKQFMIDTNFRDAALSTDRTMTSAL
jgi:hypothetical protein